MPRSTAHPAFDMSEPVNIPDPRNVAEHLIFLCEQLETVQEKLAVIGEQQAEIRALLLECLHRAQTIQQAGESVPPSPPAPAETVLAECAQDVVRVLHEVGHALTTLEILEELVRRHASWRENTVRHALTELLDKGIITVTGDAGPYCYQLRPGSDNPDRSAPPG